MWVFSTWIIALIKVLKELQDASRICSTIWLITFIIYSFKMICHHSKLLHQLSREYSCVFHKNSTITIKIAMLSWTQSAMLPSPTYCANPADSHSLNILKIQSCPESECMKLGNMWWFLRVLLHISSCLNIDNFWLIITQSSINDCIPIQFNYMSIYIERHWFNSTILLGLNMLLILFSRFYR